MVKAKTKTKQKVAERHQKTGITNYPVGDFLIRVKNTALAGRSSLLVKSTKFVYQVAKVLVSEGFLSEAKLDDGMLTVSLAIASKEPVLMGLKLVSKPGFRQYMGAGELAKLRGPEIYVIATPKGVMSGKDAIKKNVGGEIIAKIW